MKKMIGFDRKWSKMRFYCHYLLLVLLIISTTTVSANDNYSQEKKFNLKLKNASIERVLKEIESTSEFKFFYNHQTIDLSQKVNVHVSGSKVTEILDQVFEGTGINYQLKDRQIVLKAGSAQNQQKVVTGVVTDAEGVSMPGVTVLIKGTTVGTITDGNGAYSIKVNSEQDILLFSFVGMKPQEVAVAGNSKISVTLQVEDTEVEEVVVTALGIKKERKTIGYAITEIKGQEIAESNTVSPVEALQGKVAGVDIARTDGGTFGGTRITIRGNATLGDNNQPIYVVDGVVMDNDVSGGDEWGGSDWGNNLKNLNPDDFESVTVLKGAAATALYGSRALHGAVVVTTKKGTQRRGIGIDISQTFNVKHVYDSPAFQNVYGEGAPPGYDSELDDMFYPQGEFLTNEDGEPYLPGNSGWIPLSFGHKMDGSQVRDWDGEWINYVPQEDNYKNVFETGLHSNTNVSLSGGNETTTFRLSYSFTDENGIYYNNNFTRNALSTRVTHELTDFIRADVGISYSASDLLNPPTGSIQQAFVTGSFPRNYDTNKWKKQYKAPHGGVHNSDYNDPLWMVPGHSLWFSYYENEYARLEESLRLTGKVTADITPWFNMMVEGYINNYYTNNETKELGQGYANEGGKYELGHTRKQQKSIKFLANFNKELTDDLNASLSLGGERWSSETTSSSAWTNGGLIVPGQYSISNSKNTAGSSAKYSNERALNSLYFFAEFSYRNQLFVNITGRNDWSSTLTYMDGSGNNSYFYPSVSTSWIFSETFAVPEWISFGKLRASYAEVGNDYKPYSINSGYKKTSTIENQYGDLPAFSYTSKTVPNNNIKPERKQTIEIGTDLSFLKNRIGLDFAWYKSSTTDQILSLGVPSASGVTSQLVNAGEIENKGIEVLLKTKPIVKKNFSWDMDFSYTKNKTKVVELIAGQDMYTLEGSAGYGNTRIASVAYVGGEYGALVSDSSPLLYDGAGEKNGMPILRWNSGQRGAHLVRNNTVEQVGSSEADWLGSITNTFHYKNFRLRVLLDFKFGGQISSYSNRYGMAYGLFENSLAYRDAEHGGFEWTSDYTGNSYDDGYIPEGVFEQGTVVDGNDVGGLSYQEAYEMGLVEPMHGSYWHWKNNNWGLGVINDDVLLENSYIGIREVVFGYNVPKTFCNKLRLTSLDLSFFGRDLGFLYNSLPNNLNPFSIRSNRSGAAHEWGLSPYVMTLGMTVKIGI
ncbi:SusC/RagA family TonB-linked outer membrane protein [Puteibacter caeruleilacunae]|nr:SusC/RagA family TonB-linked outer membrane protein [Puteibacter caeruleilacunae]